MKIPYQIENDLLKGCGKDLIGELGRVVDLRNGIFEQMANFFIVYDSFFSVLSVLHDVLQLIKQEGIVGVKRKEIVLERCAAVGANFMKVSRIGEMDISLTKGNLGVAGNDRALAVGDYRDLKPIAVRVHTNDRVGRAMQSADLNQQNVAKGERLIKIRLVKMVFFFGYVVLKELEIHIRLLSLFLYYI